MGRRRWVAIAAVALLATGLGGCREVKLGTKCATKEAASSGAWVAVCKNGRWTKWITKADGQRLLDEARRQAAEHAAAAAASQLTNVPEAPLATTPVTTAPSTVAPTTAPPTTIPPLANDCAVLCQALRMPDGTSLTSSLVVQVLDVPTTSPDGRWIAFRANTGDTGSGGNAGYTGPVERFVAKNVVTGQFIYLDSAPDGSYQPDAANPDANYGLKWSPDSTRVLIRTGAHVLAGVTGVQQYARNVVTNQVTLISQDAAGHPGNDTSGDAEWNPDGTNVAFVSAATNWATGSTVGTNNVYVKNLATGALTLVSAGAGGQASNASVINPIWSPDGRRLAYGTTATNIVPVGPLPLDDIVAWDSVSHVSTLVDAASDGTPADHGGSYPQWMADSRNVVFATNSINVFPHAGQGLAAKNVVTGAVTPVSVDPQGSMVPCWGFDVSPDGRHVAFETVIDNSNAVAIRDLTTATTTYATTNGTRLQGWNPTWSPDGHHLAMATINDAAPGDHNQVGETYDIYVIDVTTGTTIVASAGSDGIARGGTVPIAWNGTGTMVFFNLDGGDWPGWNTNTRYAMRRIP